jgi:hypothetical protein
MENKGEVTVFLYFNLGIFKEQMRKQNILNWVVASIHRNYSAIHSIVNVILIRPVNVSHSIPTPSGFTGSIYRHILKKSWKKKWRQDTSLFSDSVNMNCPYDEFRWNIF